MGLLLNFERYLHLNILFNNFLYNRAYLLALCNIEF